MAKEKKVVRPFTINALPEKAAIGAAVFGAIKKGDAVPIKNLAEKIPISGSGIEDLVNSCIKKDLLKISASPKGDAVRFNEKYGMVLGIGFADRKCFVTAEDAGGGAIFRESAAAGLIQGFKGKNKEISAIAEEIASASVLKDKKFVSAGVAVPEEMTAANSSSAEILGGELLKKLGCPVFTAGAASAAAYGERDASAQTKGKDILYLHSDVGSGVVIKGEAVFEAAERAQGKDASYLSPWRQFGMVQTAKELVNKGIGTDIVNMVSGDADSITLDVVLEAAANNDELADDLVRRAGLALGVRAAYLVNIFGTTIVVIGGGVEGKEGNFIKYVKESQERFLLEKFRGKAEVLPGKLGKEASALGAAALCRRELFMEV